MNNASDRCFICFGEDDLKKANLCCGVTVYHANCLDQYCNNQNETIFCPICKKNITNKFEIKESNIVSYEINWIMVKFILYVIVLTGVGIMYYCAGTHEKKFKWNPYVNCAITIALTPLANLIYINDAILKAEWSVYSSELQKFFIVLPMIINPSVLLITSTISFYNPKVLSFNTITDIFICTGWLPFIIFSILSFVYLAATIFYIIYIWLRHMCEHRSIMLDHIKYMCCGLVNFCSCIRSTHINRSSYTVIEEYDSTSNV